MYVLMSPQVDDTRTIHYRFVDETITVTLGSVTDIFDFNGLPVGEVGSIETTLSVNPIVHAERKADGQMYVELINFITDDAPESDKFPNWTVV
jgi:hypothetical protein